LFGNFSVTCKYDKGYWFSDPECLWGRNCSKKVES